VAHTRLSGAVTVTPAAVHHIHRILDIKYIIIL